MQHRLSLNILTACTLLAAVMPTVRADVQSEYDAKWGSRERKATIPSERAKLANDLMDRVEEIVAGKKRKRDALDKAEAQLAALSGDRRAEVMLLSQKAYQLGSRQRESYAPAARALGVIQTIDPSTRLDSLLKLLKIYDDAHMAGTSRKVGISKGLAEVLLQVADEQRSQLMDKQSRGKITAAEQVAAVKTINANYTRGLEVVRSAINSIRPYASGNKSYQEFLTQAGDVEKEIVDAQKRMADLTAFSTELDRNLRTVPVLQSRLSANPKDVTAGDRLVRLYMNELDDPKALEASLPKASDETRTAVGLMKKPVSRLTGPEALAVAQWCDKNNDNAASPNRSSMNIRTRVYCEAYKNVTKGQGSGMPQINAIATRIDTELAKAQVPEEEAKKLVASYVAALEPPAPPPVPAAPPPPRPTIVAVTPEETEPPKEETPAAPPPPAVATAEPVHEIKSIRVESAAAKEPQETKKPTSIFDFGLD